MGLLGQIERRVRFGVVCCAWTRGSAEMAFYDQINWENFLDLIYWRDTQKSGVVYGSGMAFLLLLRWMSLISVVSYMSLFALTGTMTFRIYKNVMQAIQKTQDGHPFKEFLEMDVTIPEDKVKHTTEVALTKLNCWVSELRRLFLVEDFVDSLKFGVLLWCLTYIGSWFNSSTLIILGYVALFTLPKVYEINQVQIDQYIDLVRTHFEEIQSKVRSMIPLGGSKEKAQ